MQTSAHRLPKTIEPMRRLRTASRGAETLREAVVPQDGSTDGWLQDAMAHWLVDVEQTASAPFARMGDGQPDLAR